MNKVVLYDFKNSDDVINWKLEGHGAIEKTNSGNLRISTERIAANMKATNAWLRDIELPDNFEMSFEFKSDSENGNTMVIFNAQPFELDNLWADPREDAAYCDLASFSKMQAYTVGFHRATYGRPSVLRKIGGKVPERWGTVSWPSAEWHEMDEITKMNSANEPLLINDKGKKQSFRLEKFKSRITFYCNGIVVHDCYDELQYPYCDKVLIGGRMAFRNFGGPADDYYSNLIISEIKD
jgi:hypothetical protein